MRWVLVMVLVGVVSSSARAQVASGDAYDVARSSGLAVALSLGYQSPVGGGQLDYYVTSPSRPIGLAGYLGTGWYPGITVDGVTTNGSLGFAGGVFGFLGHHHRIVVDLSYGSGALEAQVEAGTIIRQDMLYGATLAGGYEYMHRGGFFVRATFGATLLTGDIYADESRIQPTLDLAVGLKIL